MLSPGAAPQLRNSARIMALLPQAAITKEAMLKLSHVFDEDIIIDSVLRKYAQPIA